MNLTRPPVVDPHLSTDLTSSPWLPISPRKPRLTQSSSPSAPRHRPAAARDPGLARQAPARVRPRRRADDPRVGEGDRLPYQDRAQVRRRAAGVHPALRRARPVDAGRDDHEQEVRRAPPSRPCSARSTWWSRRSRALGDNIDLVGSGTPCVVTGRVVSVTAPAARRHPRRVAGQRPGLLRRAAARRAAAHQRPRPVHGRRERRVLVPHDHAELLPDPDRRPGRRTAPCDRQARVPPGAHPLHRRPPPATAT